MNVLLVGAGAVGQVYARHLSRGGAQVSFYVKPKYVDELEQGLRLHVHQLMCKPSSVNFKDYGVLSSLGELRAQSFDQIWICVSATALRAGWLPEFVEAAGEGVTWVNLTPGLEDRAFLVEHVGGEDKVVSGMIGFIAYQSPLPEETLDPGVAYLLPVGSPSLFSGPSEATLAAVGHLKAGGCNARAVDSATRQAAMGSAVMMPHIAALELAGWSFSELKRGPLLDLAGRAAREFLAVAADYHDTTPPGALKAIRPWVMRVGLSVAPVIMPFDLEVYLQYHFTKVGDQTRAMLARNVEIGRDKGLEVGAMAELVEKLQ